MNSDPARFTDPLGHMKDESLPLVSQGWFLAWLQIPPPHRLCPYLAFTSSGVESPSACCPAIESEAMGLLLGPLGATRQDHSLGKLLKTSASSSGT